MKNLALLFIMLLTSFHVMAGWTENPEEIYMKSKAATAVSATGDEKFSVAQITDGSIWGFIELDGMETFSKNQGVVLRVDKNKSVSFSSELDRILKNPIYARTWEQSEKRASFQMWRGSPENGCGFFQQLYDGKNLAIRYFSANNEPKDINIDISKGNDILAKVAGINMADCKVNP